MEGANGYVCFWCGYRVYKEMSKEEFEFIIYMIHACARKWHKSPADVYHRLTSGDRIMNYLISNYDVLHTQGTDFVVSDIEELAGICGDGK